VAGPGQQVNITLVNFARVGLPALGTSGSPRHKVCYQLAAFREPLFTRVLTECEGSTSRTSHAFTSTSNVVEVDIIVAKVLKVFFLLHFQGTEYSFCS
jgi:hypothetical protein